MALTKVKSSNITLTTPSASSNDTSPATTAYVTTALANLVDSAPGTLNTLNELAAALGDDANFSTTVTNSIAGKLPLAGGTMTGDLILGDSVQIELGAASGGDLRLYHDGSNSHIKNVGSSFYIATEGSGNDLYLRADDDIFIQPQGGENGIKVIGNSSVELYYDNALKLLTSSTGINLPIDGEAIKFGADSDIVLTHEHDIGLALTGDLTASGVYVGSRNATYDFYNNGTTYLNQAVTIDDTLTLTGSSARVIIGTGYRMDDNGTTNAGRLGFNRNPADGSYLSSSSYQRFQINGPGSSGDFLDIQNYSNSGSYHGSLRMDGGDVRLQSQKAGHTIFKVTGSYADGYRHGVEVANTHTGGLTHSIFSTNNSDGYFGGGKFVIANETMGDVDANTAGIIVMDSYGVVLVDTVSAPNYPGTVTTARTGSSSTTTQNTWGFNATAGGSHKDFGFKASGTGSYAYGVLNAAETTWMSRLDFGGAIHLTNTTVQSISDRRLKKDIVDANSQWDDIKALQFKNFKWIDEAKGTDTYLGLIADEVESVSPSLVGIDAISAETMPNDGVDPEYKNVKYSIVWMKAVKALQEAMTKIETLETELETAKARIETLEG